MSSGTWVYLLVPVGDLDSDLPSQITRYDYETWPDPEGPPVMVHPTYRTAAEYNRSNCALGASDGTLQIFKFANCTLNAGEDLDQFRALRGSGDAYKLLSQEGAAQWAGNITPPDDGE